jgi:hypothetical protein
MTSQTRQLIESLSNLSWFSSAGRPFTSAKAGAVIPAKSWEQAIELSGSTAWENFQLEQANAIRAQLTTAQMQEWNDRVDSVKALWSGAVEDGFERALHARRLPKVVGDGARWDVLHAAMESEYADVVRPGFYSGSLQLYRDGRFPCGWGVVNAAGEIELAEMEPDLDPADPDYFRKLVNWPIDSTFFREIRLPEGQLIVF